MSESTVDLTNFPTALAEALTIDLFPAQILASTILIGLFVFPTLFLSKKFQIPMIATIIMALLSMSFCIAVEWLDYWFLLVVAMIIALMFSGKMRSWVSG